jgi:heterodisulfide reductase subunit A-like polyferredoxin
MFCLESREEMPASDNEVEEALEDNVDINCGWGPKQILSENGKVTGIVFKKCTSVKDETGRFNPTYDENDTITVECDNVILSIGQSIEWGNILDGSSVELNRNKTAVADSKTLQTAQADVFVGGDAYTGPSFAIDAIAMGKEAAISIHRFVQPHSSLTIGRNPRYYIELDKDNLAIESYDNSSRQIPKATQKVDKKLFRDDNRILTEKQVKIETARCLGCGATIVDPNRCVGCGICTTKCEFDAIHLNRERPECSTMVTSEDKMKAIIPYMIKREIKIKFGKK